MSDLDPQRVDPFDRPMLWASARLFLKYAIAFVLVGSAAFVAGIVVFAPDQGVRAFGPASMSLVAAFAWALLARGRVEAAVHVLAFGLWAAVTGIAFFTGGVRGMAIIVYPQLILLLGWLAGTRAAVVMAALAVTATLGFALAESWEFLPLSPPTPPALRWIVQSFVFAFSVILIVSFVRSYQDRLRKARQDLTERKFAEEALRESENRFRHLTALSSDWYWEQDENCRFTFISPGVDVQKRGVGEHIGRTRWELPHVDTDPEVKRENDALVAARKPFRDLVIKRIGRDDTVRYAQVSGDPVFDERGQFKGYRGVGSDITERMLAEEALRESEMQLQCILAATADGVLAVDRDGKVIRTNQRFAELWRIPQSLLDRKDDQALLEYVVGELADPAAFLDKVRALYQSDAELTDTVNFKDGRIFERYTSPLILNRSVVGRVWCFRDITERMRAEGELSKSIAFRELLLEALPLPVFYKDTSGRYAGGNSAFAAFIGRSIEDTIGKTVYDLWPRSYAQTYRDKDIDLLNDPLGLEPYESRIPHADGTIHDVIVHKARMVDAAGTPTGILGVFTDITEIKQIEAVRDQLEAQLRESQKMEALGTLAGGVAHDFNNIVATIMGNVELALRDVGPDAAVLESLEEISKASRRAKELVRQILAFGRRQVLERKLILLAPVVEESVRLLRATLPAGVSLSAACAPDAPAVFADATQVQQVLLNLCANASQAIEEQQRPGSVEVRLSTYDHVPGKTRVVPAADRRSELRAGCYACLTVSDNGPGMDAATRARIFEPFFTTKPVGKGTGLGLAVVHGIAQEHGARIEVDSAPGAGTTFRIYFPAVRAVLPATAAPVAERAPAQGQGRRILYVDDDEAIVFLMTRLLERQGYRVSGYTDAREALAAARAAPEAFDLAVTDYNMPGMSGLEVARELRQIRADLPVALASGYITEELRAQAPAAGVSELIYKPNTADELCEAIARLANLQRGEKKPA